MSIKISNLLELIKASCETHTNRNKVAFKSTSGEITYEKVWEYSDNFAGFLIQEQGADKSPVIILGQKEPEMLIGFLGAVKSGRAYIPVDSTTPQERINKIIEISGAKVVVTAEQIKQISQTKTSVTNIQNYWVQKQEPFYILFTSGSTGEPKGVVLTRECLESFMDWFINDQKFYDSEAIFINQAPLTFDVSLMDLYVSLIIGAQAIGISKDEISNFPKLYSWLQQSNANIWISTPTFAQLCLLDKSFNSELMPHLTRFVFCGEALAQDIVKSLFERFPNAEVWNTYGPTEATVAVTSVQITPEMLKKYNPLPLGYPRPNNVIEIENGEITIAGDNVSTGYLARPEKTAEVFFTKNGMRAYKTGDSGYFQDGLLFTTGRIDNQIKLHGHRIELGDIENNIKGIEGVKAAIVVVKNAKTMNEFLVAFVIAEVQDNTVKNELAKKVPAYMMPRKFVFVEKYPLNPNGKADRKKLLEGNN